jgi:hypothetical protein
MAADLEGASAMVDRHFPSMDASSAVSPTVRITGDRVELAYYLPGCQNSAVVSFFDVSSWRYGEPNDEGLAQHPLWNHGLRFYEFHEVVPRDMDARRWVATFHDGTFEIVAREATVRSGCVGYLSPSRALDRVLGAGDNRVLDDEAA